MPKNHHFVDNNQALSKSKNRVNVKATFDLEVFLVSSDKLEQIQEYTNDTPIFGAIMFLFSICITSIVTLLVTTIASRIVFLILIGIATVSFTAGVLKLNAHKKERRRINKIVQSIKRNKCDLISNRPIDKKRRLAIKNQTPFLS